jgi:hypothetical protein
MCGRNKLKCVLYAKYYWHDRNNKIIGKCDEGRPLGRGRFTVEDGTEMDVKEIMYVVIE